MSEVRLIDANKLKEELEAYRHTRNYKSDEDEAQNSLLDNILEDIDNAPTVVERPKGEWIGDTDLDNTCKCSKCRKVFDVDRLKMVMCDGKYEMPPSCPNCGADMRGDNNG